MKTSRVSFVVTSIFIAIVTIFMPQNSFGETLHSSSEQSDWVVPIFLPNITTIPEFNTDKWIDLADLPSSDRPESSYQGFLLPHINAVYTRHKYTIDSLTKNCSIILIDYKQASSDELTALPVEQIVAIGICGPQARIVTTAAITSDSNPALISADLMEFVSLAKASGYN